MERRFEVRLRELLDDAMVFSEQLRGMLTPLEEFVEPFAASLVRSKQWVMTRQYVAGLSDGGWSPDWDMVYQTVRMR